MKTLKITTFSGLFALIILVLAACGGTTSTSTTTASSTTPAPTPTATSSSGSYAYGSGQATPTTSASTSSSASVKTATAMVNGKNATILTDAQGMTLYYFTPDTKTTSACGSGCTSSWPPLLLTGSGQPASVAGLSGKLTAVSDANGQQVQYNGHFLYTYSGDSSAGQTNGEGVGGKWYVATASLT